MLTTTLSSRLRGNHMRIFLRAIAVLLGVVVILQALLIISMVASGELTTLARSGALGILTFAGWLIVLTAGPFAAVQLWRLQRIGLFVTAVLCGLACGYYVVGLFFFRAPSAPLRSILMAVVINAALLALVLSPRARRACS